MLYRSLAAIALVVYAVASATASDRVYKVAVPGNTGSDSIGLESAHWRGKFKERGLNIELVKTANVMVRQSMLENGSAHFSFSPASAWRYNAEGANITAILNYSADWSRYVLFAKVKGDRKRATWADVLEQLRTNPKAYVATSGAGTTVDLQLICITRSLGIDLRSLRVSRGQGGSARADLLLGGEDLVATAFDGAMAEYLRRVIGIGVLAEPEDCTRIPSPISGGVVMPTKDLLDRPDEPCGEKLGDNPPMRCVAMVFAEVVEAEARWYQSDVDREEKIALLIRKGVLQSMPFDYAETVRGLPYREGKAPTPREVAAAMLNEWEKAISFAPSTFETLKPIFDELGWPLSKEEICRYYYVYKKLDKGYDCPAAVSRLSKK